MYKFLSRDHCQPRSGQHFEAAGEPYVLRGRLGNGAAGIVRKAVHRETDRPFAVKFLAPDPKYIDESAFEDVAHRFRREGIRGSHLRHDHLVEIVAYSDNESSDAGKAFPANPFIVMEYMDSRTLESYILKHSTDPGRFTITRRRLSIAVQLAAALEFLRDRRLIHRDVKPANVFLSKRRSGSKCWEAKLGDFGVMKWGDFHAAVATGTLTVTSQKNLGTLKYMSPEQAIRPKQVTSRSDVYSLGITLFELFTGRVLLSPHHVYEIRDARRTPGNTYARFASLQVDLKAEDAELGDLLLDMFLAASGRPTIDKVRGRLEWEYERRFGAHWDEDLR